MAKVRIGFDFLESVAFLVAIEYMRQMGSDDNVPLISSFSTGPSDAALRVSFAFKGADFVLDIVVQPDDTWPRKGVVHLHRVDLAGDTLEQPFKLRGNSLNPEVVFIE